MKGSNVETIESFAAFLKTLDPNGGNCWQKVYGRIGLAYPEECAPERTAAIEAPLKDSISERPLQVIAPGAKKTSDTQAQLDALLKQLEERRKTANTMTPEERMARQEATAQRGLQ